ncbi:hypothetical protein [Serinibacter arcticus]|uniref:DUF559 domain-containing protein n=1 Tax=Serinibacter arcticus TaxID=1655435 RepID=A0A4Z1DY42_9MICO|nr:hypothetical protein [Serinibacter arcticus]TGO03970.1 hypothetical protein SERN_2561 [Serinibacter arcticus]
MHVLSRLADLGGSARFSELGAQRSQLARLEREGRLNREGTGLYSLPGAPRDLLAAARLAGVVSCVSALRADGVDVPGDASIIHCSVPRHRGTARIPGAGLVRHHEDVGLADRPRTAASRWAAARAVQCLPLEPAVAALDAVAGRFDKADVDDVLGIVSARSPRRAALLLDLVDPACRSWIETSVRLALRRHGLRVRAGLTIAGVGEVDLLVEGVLIMEIDGFAYHSGRGEYRRDRRRDVAGLARGFPTVRLAYEDATQPALVVASALGALDAVGWKPLATARSVPSSEATAAARVRRRALIAWQDDPRGIGRAVGGDSLTAVSGW